jgi:hypothetical protein
MALALSWLDEFFGPAIVRVASTLFPKRPVLEFQAGAGITITAADTPANNSCQLTLTASSYVPPGAAGAVQYTTGAAFAGEGNFLFDGAGRLTVSATGYITYEAGSVPSSGLVRIPYNAGQKDIITRKDASAVNRVVLGFTADNMTFGYAGTNIAFQTAPGATFGGGTGVQFRPYATVNPTTNPTGGQIDYVDPTTTLPRTRMASGRVLTHDGCPPTLNGLRLTISTGNPIPTADVATSTSVYLTPFESGSIALYDGVSWVRRDTSEITLALGTLTSGKNYDVFAYWNGSAVALELSAAWTTDTARADALTRLDGILVKSGATTRRYVGTVRTISTTQTTDTATQRFVYNEANQVDRHLAVADATASWTYNSTTYRQARATTANRVELVLGNPRPVNARVVVAHTEGASGYTVLPGVGVDSTTVNSATPVGTFSSTAFASEVNLSEANYDGVPALGYHAFNWLEALSSGTTSTTIYGTSSGSISGLRARVRM